MGAFSFWHIIVVVLLVVVLFGKGKISGLMGDLAGGIKAFKKGMADEPAERVTDAGADKTGDAPRG